MLAMVASKSKHLDDVGHISNLAFSKGMHLELTLMLCKLESDAWSQRSQSKHRLIMTRKPIQI
jgi:hypothetical protein